MRMFSKSESSSDSSFKTVRIEKVKPFEIDYEINTDTIWFENHNIEDCIQAVEKLGIKRIHLQTNTINFLDDPRLQNINGIVMQFEVQNIEPLFNLKHLTHLSLPDKVNIEFDFLRFKNLIFLGGVLPKKYINIDRLSKLKFTYLFGYKKRDFTEFAKCVDLRKLWLYSTNIENLNGLSNLSNLTQIDLENCRRLVSLDGIDIGNVNLQTIHLVNCKNLRSVDALVNLPQLRQLQIYQINELESLNFLKSLNKLENLILHPEKVGVRGNDYYPLVETLKKLNKLENLKGWKPLDKYLQNTFIVDEAKVKPISELDLIKKNLGIMNWVEKSEHGLKQYTKKNCREAETIFLDLIKKLESLEEISSSSKEELIMHCVLKLNKLNDDLGGDFIETAEREELSDLLDNIADAVGLNVLDYQDGIAAQWRDWL